MPKQKNEFGKECPCCREDSLVTLLFTEDKNKTYLPIFHCKNCCALVPGYASQDEDVILHQADFHAAYWENDLPEQVVEEARKMLGVVDFYRGQLLRHSSGTPILDLGGGRGLLMSALLKRGYNALGCDPSKELVAQAHGTLNIPEHLYVQRDMVSFALEHSSDLNGKVGAIFLWHVIEHLERPMDVIQAIRPLLRPDGIIIAQGPLLDPEYIFPEHRFLHSESNITWIARELGMKLLFLDSFSRERFISFILAEAGHDAAPIKGIYMPEIQNAAGALFNTISRALSFARKH